LSILRQDQLDRLEAQSQARGGAGTCFGLVTAAAEAELMMVAYAEIAWADQNEPGLPSGWIGGKMLGELSPHSPLGWLAEQAVVLR